MTVREDQPLSCRAWKRDTRWYECRIFQDLFGNWTVRRSWGDVVSRRVGMKEHLCGSEAEAESVMEYVAKRRRRRGYERVDG